MERIRELFVSFSKSEVKSLKTYLTAFHSKGENKQLELICLIEKNPATTQEAASKKLYGDPKSKGFIMMKSRLYEKMLEILPLSVFTEGRKTDGEEHQRSLPVEVRKMLMSGQELVRRKLFSPAAEIFEDAYIVAKKHAMHEMELDALLRMTVYKNMMDNKPAINDTGSHVIEIQNMMKKLDVYIKAVCTKELFSSRFSLAAGNDEAKIKFLEAAIPPLEADLEGLDSAQAEYLINALKILYFSLLGSVDECRDVIQKQLKVIPRLGTEDINRRYPNLFYQIAILELKAHDYKASIAAFQKTADHYLNSSSHTYFKLMVSGIYPLIYDGDITAIRTRIEHLESLRLLPANKSNPKQQSLLTFFNVIYLYKSGELKKAWQLVQTIDELDFDKEGWVAGIKTLEIMFLIELNEFDIASARIETLRKHISRYPGDKRVEVMQKLLAGQDRISFSFDTFKTEETLLQNLEHELRWVHIGHEVIRYDIWYRRVKQIRSSGKKS